MHLRPVVTLPGVQKVGIRGIQDIRQSGSQKMTNQAGPKAQLGLTKVIWLDKSDLLYQTKICLNMSVRQDRFMIR